MTTPLILCVVSQKLHCWLERICKKLCLWCLENDETSAPSSLAKTHKSTERVWLEYNLPNSASNMPYALQTAQEMRPARNNNETSSNAPKMKQSPLQMFPLTSSIKFSLKDWYSIHQVSTKCGLCAGPGSAKVTLQSSTLLQLPNSPKCQQSS